ncbi:hypothetical protein FOMPIDRAFT_1031788 [Fomitopsis schrenkii]|uniref:Uncharacterized protein n=1 Tax=Fomitopsis schrenkii TaxID=2126942 RepID=S8F845_FOMSC|nr:hypothetical protein FOMPIDRAFT_1031788 [Fomitopsis schrenkii]
MMKTDILFSSPRLRFSREQQEAVLAWGRELGARDVPTLYSIEKFQSAALKSIGDPTRRVQADSGNVFYINSLVQAMARDYAHPSTRQQIHAFPEFTAGGPVSEVWQSSKWLEDAPDDVLTPMIRLGDKDYYIKELAYCCDQSWFIPMRFFTRKGEMTAYMLLRSAVLKVVPTL